ncbi:MAG: hypothetical protein KAQ62_12425, partial [Cyclobacteriaceae bacterium]|nr:hypothetical protein [Cyclobacteriaceae bacterium]
PVTYELGIEIGIIINRTSGKQPISLTIDTHDPKLHHHRLEKPASQQVHFIYQHWWTGHWHAQF